MKSKIFTHKIEKMKSDILVDPKYKEIVKEKIEARPGVYALYKKNGKLYYIGRSNRMKHRLQAHIKDRHHGKWERFSVYFTKNNKKGEEDTKSIEDALISVAGKPDGNTQSPSKIKPLNKEIERDMEKIDYESRKDITGGKRKKKLKVKKKKAFKKRGVATTKNPFGKRKPLKKRYKDKDYKAIWLRSGKVKHGNKTYLSPTAAAKVASGRKTINGRSFWRVQDSKGHWVRLKDCA